MMSPKRDPYRESDKRGLFLQEFARVLYEKKQFAISFAGPFDVFRSVPVSKFEQDPGGYNVEQIKTWLKYKDLQRIKAEWIMRGLLSTVS